MSGIGSGYLSGNMLVAFPFEDGQCLAWQGSPEDKNELQSALQGCFADAVVYVDSEELSEDKWPAIGSFSVSGNSISFNIGSGPHESDVRVVVASSAVAFPIVTGSADWGRYSLVLSSEGLDKLVSLCGRLSVSPPVQVNSSSPGRDGGFWMRICAKCITARPRGLSSLMVYDGVKPRDEGPHFVMKGDVSVRPGNNMRLDEPDELDDMAGMELNAVPGAGLGRCPCMCEDSSGGNAQLAGPDGHVRFFNDTCYDLEPRGKYYDPDVGMVTQDLQVHVKCTACCTCQMYEDIVNGRLVPLANALRQAKSDINKLLEEYNARVGAFNERIKIPRLADVAVTMSAMPIGRNVSPRIKDGKVDGNMSRCAYTVVVRNSSFSNLRIEFLSISGTDSIVESSAAWSDEGGNPLSLTADSESGMIGRPFVLYPGRSLVLTYISRKSRRVKSVTTGGFRGSVSANVLYQSEDGFQGLGVVKKSVEA